MIPLQYLLPKPFMSIEDDTLTHSYLTYADHDKNLG